MQNFFDKLNDGIRNTESSIVNFLSAFAPWLAPLVPAYMTYQHAYTTLDFPFLIAVPAALVVEILGFSAVSTYLAFWFYNKKNKAEVKKAPTGLVIVAFGFYLCLIVSSNVLLDSFPTEKWAEVSVRALFTLQTIPAAMLVAVRTQHRELLSEISKERAENLRNKEKQVSEGNREVSENFPKDWRKLRPTLNHEQLVTISQLNAHQVKEISTKYGVDIKTVTNWRSYALAELENEKPSITY